MRTIIPAIGTVSFQKKLSIDGLINNNSANHYIFTTTAVIGSLMLGGFKHQVQHAQNVYKSRKTQA